MRQDLPREGLRSVSRPAEPHQMLDQLRKETSSPSGRSTAWPVPPAICSKSSKSSGRQVPSSIHLRTLGGHHYARRHNAARPALQRLLRPLEDVLDHLGAVNTVKRKYTIRTTVICLLIRAMVRYEQSFWAFSTEVWLELLGTDYYAHVRVHGVTANARHQLIAIAYLFCSFEELASLGRLAFPALARKIFGSEAFDAVIDQMKADLLTWGYSRKGNVVGLRCALAEAMLASRSLHLADLRAETLDRLYRDADAKITRRGLTILSYVLVRRGILQKPLGRDGQIERQESIAHRRVLDGVPVVRRKWCERWFATTTLQPSSRIGGLYRLFNVG